MVLREASIADTSSANVIEGSFAAITCCPSAGEPLLWACVNCHFIIPALGKSTIYRQIDKTMLLRGGLHLSPKDLPRFFRVLERVCRLREGGHRSLAKQVEEPLKFTEQTAHDLVDVPSHREGPIICSPKKH